MQIYESERVQRRQHRERRKQVRLASRHVTGQPGGNAYDRRQALRREIRRLLQRAGIVRVGEE